MKLIKTIAGEILLYLYWIQRKDYNRINDIILEFNLYRPVDGEILVRRNESIFSINKFIECSDNDLYNAIIYLRDSQLIEYNESKDNCGVNMASFEVTSNGVDLIEGIERGEKEKRDFNIIFNFNITNDITVESLLKMELGSLIKNSIL